MKYLLNADMLQMDFLEKSVYINRIFLRVGAVFAVIVECFNLCRVLFFSAGLTTLNNRIYFGFYLFYFICCVTFLILDFKGGLTYKARYRLYMFSGVVLLQWHTLFNVYDIYRTGAVGHFTIMMSVFFFCGMLIMKPVYALMNLGVCYIIFVVFLSTQFGLKEVIHFSLMVLLCGIVSWARYNHICVEISQAKMLEDVQQELTNTQRDFRLTIEQYELIREKGSYVTFEWDIEDDWIRLSKEWEDYFDQPRDISNFSQYIKSLKLLPWDQKELLISCMEDVKKGVAYQEHELLLPLKSGDTGWFELRVITQKNDQDEPVFGIGMLSDITERKEKINQLEKEIQMDLFTGLLNKAAIERYGARKLAELQKDEFLAILIIDLDDFKNINDGYGHPVGDYVLKQVAGIMRAKAPVGARVGRIGGDEFMALLVTKDLSVFQEYAHQLIREVPKIRWNEQDIGVWCSMGLAAADSSQWTYFQLYQKADDALYEAKRLGKNRLICDL